MRALPEKKDRESYFAPGRTVSGSTLTVLIATDCRAGRIRSQRIIELLEKGGDTLREIKERRQVILVTHNANIAVLGDSELILPMFSENDCGKGAACPRGKGTGRGLAHFKGEGPSPLRRPARRLGRGSVGEGTTRSREPLSRKSRQ